MIKTTDKHTHLSTYKHTPDNTQPCIPWSEL